MGLRPHYLPELILSVLAVLAAVYCWRVAIGKATLPKRHANWALAAAILLIAAGIVLAPVRIHSRLDAALVTWVRCVALFAAAGCVYAACVTAALVHTGAFRPERRHFLRAAATAAAAVPTAVSAFAIIKREELVFREVEIRSPRIRRDLDGVRIVQLSDIHLSPFVSEALLARAVGMANETQAHLAVVTGDLISRRGDPLDACIRHLAHLRADAGVFGCMGNHEIYAGAVQKTYRDAARVGIRFLRSESVRLLFGDAPLVLSGVDYQRRGRPYLPGAGSLVAPDAFNVLLSHNPDAFPAAADLRFDLTLAGHTHGGQVNFEMLHPSLNVVNFTSDFVYGLYERNGRSLYVTRGIGTIGVPARLGAPPEVALIRLCAT